MINRRQWIGGAAGLAFSMQAPRAEGEDGFRSLSAAFAHIEARRGGRLGVAVLDTGTGSRAGYRGQTEALRATLTELGLATAKDDNTLEVDVAGIPSQAKDCLIGQ